MVLRLTSKSGFTGGNKRDGTISVSAEMSMKTGRTSNQCWRWHVVYMNESFYMVKAEMKC